MSSNINGSHYNYSPMTSNNSKPQTSKPLQEQPGEQTSNIHENQILSSSTNLDYLVAMGNVNSIFISPTATQQTNTTLPIQQQQSIEQSMQTWDVMVENNVALIKSEWGNKISDAAAYELAATMILNSLEDE